VCSISYRRRLGGKTTLCREVLDIFPHLRHSVSFTTRRIRPGELHGRDYFFTGKDEFKRMVEAGSSPSGQRFTAISTALPWRHWKRYRRDGIDVILDIDCQGARQLKEKYDGGSLSSYSPRATRSCVAAWTAAMRKPGSDRTQAGQRCRRDQGVSLV